MCPGGGAAGEGRSPFYTTFWAAPTRGCILIVLVQDIARRTLGWILPPIICVFISYGFFGRYFPGLLQHPSVKFNTFVSSMYFPQEGIFGVTLWVVSTIVFHFVLFGVIAQRTGWDSCSSTTPRSSLDATRAGPRRFRWFPPHSSERYQALQSPIRSLLARLPSPT